MKIKIALYKYHKEWFCKLISWKEGLSLPGRYSRYCHSEIVFQDGLSFSSSVIDGGVRFKKIDFNHNKWDFIEIDIPKYKYNRIRKWCEKQVGDHYNFTGIFFAQILNFNLKKEGDYFCSEICTKALQQANLLCGKDALFTPPAKLALLLEKKGYSIIE